MCVHCMEMPLYLQWNMNTLGISMTDKVGHCYTTVEANAEFQVEVSANEGVVFSQVPKPTPQNETPYSPSDSPTGVSQCSGSWLEKHIRNLLHHQT